MSISLSNLQKPSGNKSKRRIGRGPGSGRGTYAGRGLKGQRARSGGKSGLQKRAIKSVILRLPKLSSQRRVKPKAVVVTLSDLTNNFPAGAVVTPKSLVKAGVVESGNRIKVLANGNITQAVKVKGCMVSKTAVEKITAAGGSVEA